MCVAFDQTGRYITAVRKSHPPVLYHVDRDTSLAEFCEKGYGNTVTRKSVCFAGQKDEVRQIAYTQGKLLYSFYLISFQVQLLTLM